MYTLLHIYDIYIYIYNHIYTGIYIYIYTLDIYIHLYVVEYVHAQYTLYSIHIFSMMVQMIDCTPYLLRITTPWNASEILMEALL